jgi:hypothetical protein
VRGAVQIVLLVASTELSLAIKTSPGRSIQVDGTVAYRIEMWNLLRTALDGSNLQRQWKQLVPSNAVARLCGCVG